MARFHSVVGADGTTTEVPFTNSEEAEVDARRTAWTANADKRNAQAVLEKHDARGFTRAWESAVAAIEDDLGEYDANVLAEKRAARAVVVG